MTYVLAVLAACANAVSSVLQRKAGRRAPKKQNLSLRLIWTLAHDRAWFGGILAVIVGFLLQATALGNGQLSVVEPILVIELPATLILASRVFRARLRRREWGSAAAMTAGLAGMLYALSPSGGQPRSVHWYAWAAGIGANLAVAAVLVAWARRGPAGGGPHAAHPRVSHGGSHSGHHGGQSSSRQAALLAVAAGAIFGLTAALMKGMTSAFSHGMGVLLTTWQLYAMVAAGLVGMFLLQSAMNAGPLVAAQPGLTLTDPVVSIMWGVCVFHESVRGGWFLVAAIVCGVIVAAAVVVLAGSPLLTDPNQDPTRPGDRTRNVPRPGDSDAYRSARR